MRNAINLRLAAVGVAAVLWGLPCTAQALAGQAASLGQPQVVRGLFPKIHLPKINLGKGAKALAYPVAKATVNGGKAVVQGGGVVVKNAQTGAQIYGATRSLAPLTRTLHPGK